jgi:hypothetical protein
MGGLRRVVARVAPVLAVAVLLLLAGCQNVGLTDWIAGFFDPIVGTWQLVSPAPTPPDKNTYEFRYDRTYTQTVVTGVNTIIYTGTYVKSDSAGTLVLTPVTMLLNSNPQSPPAPTTADVLINSEHTVMQLTVTPDVFLFSKTG